MLGDRTEEVLDVLSGNRELKVGIAPSHLAALGVVVFGAMLLAIVVGNLLSK